MFIRGERPILDLKYDILKHPRLKQTTDGWRAATGKTHIKFGLKSKNIACVQNTLEYKHGEVKNDIATLLFTADFEETHEEIKEVTHNYELLSEEDLQQLFKGEYYEKN